DLWGATGAGLRGVRGNWRIYLPMAVGGCGAVALFWRLIVSVGTGSGSGSAGFGMKDLTWYQYLFTQFRAIFVYIATFLFPANLNADWDFPILTTILVRCSIAGLIVLLAAAAATHARAAVWSSAVALWEDTVRKSPNKARDRF